MIIYLDITQFDRSRSNTGIQRVVKEFLKAILKDDTNLITCKVLSYDMASKCMNLLNNDEVKLFLNDIKNYEFKTKEKINIKNIIPNELTIFFDMDSPWHAPLQRANLYPILKENGFLIFNFIYDFVPLVLPEYSHQTTVNNFKPFLESVFKYSDMVLFDSLSACDDFTNLKKNDGVQRIIPTRTIGLGSDFSENNAFIKDSKINELLEKKYILFVGTIEARKSQEEVLNAFEKLSINHPDLNLIFIGKEGWKVNSLIDRINNHTLLNKQLYWFDNIDDNTLSHFYTNAFIVTYLSKYEGYGLPIAESLKYGNITITSKNSSMYEVGKDFADYIEFNTQNELVDIISLYLENQDLYREKKEFIKNNFISTSWNDFTNSLIDIFNNFEKSLLLKEKHLSKLQFVCISIDKENLQGTIDACDKYLDFVKEYIIITAPNKIEDFKKLKTKSPITIVDETDILEEHAKNFHLKDHQSKNWLLRACLIKLDKLEDEFIMLDDDNRPLKKLSIDKFITQDGQYNAYYFYDLLRWNHKGTEYDIGQQNMKKVLSNDNYELLSYSSHAPQIINKSIFKEVVNKYFELGLKTPIDEWSTYFNYAVSRYPYSFNKKKFETLNWPDKPLCWDHFYDLEEISFENYYSHVYKSKIFNENMTYEEKVKLKNAEYLPFIKTKKFFEENKTKISSENLAHGVCTFKNDDITLYLSNIPYFVIVHKKSNLRLKLNYKLLNPKKKKLDIEVVILLNDKIRNIRKINGLTMDSYEESIIEIPIESFSLKENIYNITFDIRVNKKFIYENKSPYLLKLIVSKENNHLSSIEINTKKTIKNKIKSIPFIGWFLRWTYNLSRLNNIKFNTFVNTNKIAILEKQTKEKSLKIDELSTIIKLQEARITDFEKNIKSHVAEEILIQTDSFQQRMDQFIFDEKIKSINE